MGAKYDLSNGYTVSSNTYIDDEDLSFKAKGILLFILSKPNGWSFSAERIAKSNKDGIEAVKSGLVELEKRSYLRRVPAKENGRIKGFDYYTNGGNTLDEISIGVKSPEGKHSELVNTDITNTDVVNTEYSKREISNSSSKEDSLSISCGETSEKVSPPKNKEPENEAIFLSMPLATVDENGNSEEVGIPVSWVEKMKTLYPTLDVESEIRKAVAWCISNPKNRKTRAGWQRYLNNWFNRAINTATRYPTSADKPSEKKVTKEQLIERFKGTKVVVL